MSHSEILAVADRTAVQNQPNNNEGAWSKLAADAYAKGGTYLAASGRELALLGQGVVWGGIKEGYDAFTKNTRQTCLNLAETVAVGAAISIAAKAGPLPLKLLASGAGMYFGYQMTDWIKNDVLSGDRWRRIGGAVSDTWSSGANMDRNIATMQKDVGLLAFDSALMFGGGALGGYAGARGIELSPRIGRAGIRVAERFVPGLKGAASLEALDLATDVRRVNSDDPFSKAEQIKKAKKSEVSVNGLKGIQDALREAKMRDLAGKDQVTRHLTDVKMPELVKQNADLKSTMDNLSGQLKAKTAELTAAQTLSGETRALKSADAKVESLQQIEKQLGAKKAELASIESQITSQSRAREEAQKQPAEPGKKGKPPAGEPEASPEVLRERARDLRREIAEGESATNKGNPNSELNKALEAQKAARAALETAEQQKPARTQALTAEIAELKGQLEQHNKTRAQLGEQMQALIDAYHTRVDALMKDATILQPVEPQTVTQTKKAQPETTGKNVTDTAGGAPAVAEPAREVKAATVQEVKSAAGGGATADLAPARAHADSSSGATAKDSAEGSRDRAAKPADPVSQAKAGGKETEAAAEAKEARQLTPEDKARLELAGRAKVALDNARPLVREARERLQAIEEAKDQRKQARQLLENSTAELAAIESGNKQFVDEVAKQKAVDELKARQQMAQSEIDKAQETVKRIGSGQYFQAMKGIGRYATAVEEYFVRETDATRRQEFAAEAVRNLEALLDDLPQSRQGVKPPADNLTRRGHFGKELERVTEIREHVANRLAQMDNKHDARLNKILSLPAVNEAFGRATSGALRQDIVGLVEDNLEASKQRIVGGAKPERMNDRDWNSIQARIGRIDIGTLAGDPQTIDAVHRESSVVFFDQNGKLIGQVGTDNKFRPKYFDVPAILRGPGRGGAGVDRLLGENPVGYAVVAPKVRLTFGGRAELHQIGSNSKGAPVFNKEVVATGGRVPEFVSRGTPANRLSSGDGKSASASRFRPRTTSDKAVELRPEGENK